MVPRQQVIPFTALPGREVDLTFHTKYDHDKVVGVVLLPDRNIHDDTIFLEINREKILPRGFNAGLIAFRQFLNRDIAQNTYSFEEWARGSDVRIIYKNNDTRSVNIDMVLFTVIGNTIPIATRKKLQIVPVPFLQNPQKMLSVKVGMVDEERCIGRDPYEIRTKTDFYYQELTGIFIDYHNHRFVEADLSLNYTNSKLGQVIHDFITLYRIIEEGNEENQQVIEHALGALQNKLADDKELVVADKDGPDGQPIEGNDKKKYDAFVAIMRKSVEAYYQNELFITQKNLDVLLDATEPRYIYDDVHQAYSTLELTVDSVPCYPKDYTVANITPRYRKTFNETMYRTSMQVHEADIFISYEDKWIRYDPDLSQFEPGKDWNNYTDQEQRDFSIYFQYNQTSKKRINP